MTTGGWITLLLSVGFVTALLTWCIVRVLRGPAADRDHFAHVEPVREDEAENR